MFYFLCLLLVPALAFSTPAELERLNFFPKSRAFAQLDYSYLLTRLKAKPPASEVKTIREHINTFSVSYGQHLSPSWILGVNFPYESATETGYRYGIDTSDHHHSVGFLNPGIFSLIRLREQNDEHGLVDLYLFHRPYTGQRRVGGDDSNRKLGRSFTSARISHGLSEDEREFRTSLAALFFGEGSERHLEADLKSKLSSFTSYQFGFDAQYLALYGYLFYAGVGFIINGIETISSERAGDREVERGTSSVFNLGVKYTLSRSSLLRFGYTISNSDYFIQSQPQNFDGEQRTQTFELSFIRAF